MARNTNSYRRDLIWQIEAGVDECIEDSPLDRFVKPPVANIYKDSDQFNQEKKPNPKEVRAESLVQHISDKIKSEQPHNSELLPEQEKSFSSGPERAALSSVAVAGAVNTISELRAAVEGFTGCGLKKTAINTVFSDGNSSAKIMFIGSAPGADEDRKGLPFSGTNGQFLNKILASINVDRSGCYLTNIVFWRPPGDREPTPEEIAACIPFAERHIELVSPDILVLLGGSASKTLLGMKESITKIHGQWFDYSTHRMVAPILAIPFYHPVHLLNSPVYKRDAWFDLLKIKQKLDEKR